MGIDIEIEQVLQGTHTHISIMAGRILKAGFLYQRKKDSNLQSSATLSKLFSSSSSKKSKNASESRRYVVLTENTHDDSATLTLFKKALYDEVSEPTNILRIDSNRSYVEVDIQIESSFYIHIETFPLSKAQVLYRGILLKRSDHFGQWRARSFTITMGGRLFFYSEKKGYQVIRIHSQCRMAVYVSVFLLLSLKIIFLHTTTTTTDTQNGKMHLFSRQQHRKKRWYCVLHPRNVEIDGGMKS